MEPHVFVVRAPGAYSMIVDCACGERIETLIVDDLRVYCKCGDSFVIKDERPSEPYIRHEAS